MKVYPACCLVLCIVFSGCAGSDRSLQTPLLHPRADAPQVWQMGPGVDHWRKFQSFEGGPQPMSMAADRAANVYYLTGAGVNKVNYSGTVTRLGGPTAANSGAGQISYGNDSNLWLAVGDIYRMTQSGSFTKYATSSPAQFVTPGASADVWYTSDAVYDFNYGYGTTRRYAVPSALGMLGAITLGPDKNIWFLTANAINKLVPSTGAITSYAYQHIGGTIQTYPQQTFDSIVAGPDGNIWSLDSNNWRAFRTSTSGAIAGPFSVPSWAVYPQIAIQAGALWFSAVEYDGANFTQVVIRMNTDGSTQTFVPPNGSAFYTSGGIPGGITSSIDGNVWFNTSDIGVYILLPLIVTPYTLSFSGAGQSATVSVSQPPYTGPWTAFSTQNGVAVVSRWVSANQFVVRSVGAGSGRIIVRDMRDNYYDVPVMVK